MNELNKLIKRITEFLRQSESNVIAVSFNGNRLSKETMPKYLFTFDDIMKKFGGVEEMLDTLPEYGFGNGTKLDMKRKYGQGASLSPKVVESIELNFFPPQAPAEELPMQQAMNTYGNTSPNKIPSQASGTVPPAPTGAVPMAMQVPMSMGYPNVGLGYTPVPNEEWVTQKVKGERYEDLKRDYDRLQGENLDLRKQILHLEQEKGSLKTQLDTAELRADLNLKTELLNKKGFYESPAFEKITEALGAVAPMIAEKYMASSAPVAALAAPELSEVKKTFIAIISDPEISDEKVNELYEQLTNEQQYE